MSRNSLVRKIPVLVAAAALSVGCRGKVPEPESRHDVAAPAASVTAAAAPVVPPRPAPPAPALKKEDEKVGTGPEVKSGDTVRVHYTGKLLDGTKFDSSLDRNEPFQFTVGAGMVIKGWDQGLVGMKKGGKRRLTIPGDLAYGKRGSPPKIPPDATLVFDIELVEIQGSK